MAGTYGPAVRSWMRQQLGITFGRWQQYAIDQVLRHDARGDLIARVALLSTGRQNGKTVIVRSLIDWVLDSGQHAAPFSSWSTILAAAHDAKQARIVYGQVHDDLHNRRLTRTRARLSMYQGISAGRLDFDIVTGQPGSSRGWSAGLIGWDEMLTQRSWDMWEALYPTQSAQRSPLMILTSTAGHDDSIVLRAFYDRLIRQATGAEAPDPTFYGAWWQSLDPDAQLDWAELARANPGIRDGRLTRRALESEYAILPADSWRRERMNHFIDRRADAAIAPAAWAACRLRDPLKDAPGPFALGIDVQPGGVRATIAVAAVRADGRIGVEIFRDLRAGVGQVIGSQQLLTELHRFKERIARVAYDKAIGAASAFERDALESFLPWDGLTPGAMVDACKDVDEMIASGRLAIDDPLLDAQMPHVARRLVGNEGAFRFSRGLSTGPIDAFLAMVLAAHAIAYGQQLPQVF